MLSVPSDVWDALAGSHVRRRFYGTAQYQGRQVPLQLDSSGDVSFSSTKGVQGDATVKAVGFGNSQVPHSMTDMLAPYGQEVSLFWDVLMRGDTTYQIPLGVFRITENDGGRESFSRGAVTDWDVSLTLADRFHVLERGKLVDPKSPRSVSMWTELQRLSLFPLIQSLPDATVPPGMAYDERLSAIWDLAALAGGVPSMTRQGSLTLRAQDRWLTATVPQFDLSGTIQFRRRQSDDFYNYVWAHSDDNRYAGVAALSDDADPRSVGRAGPVTYEHSSPVYVSLAGAEAGAQTILTRLLNRRSGAVSATVGPQGMLLELGDFGWVRDPVQGRAALGEVTAVTIPNDPTAPVSLELAVAEES